MNDKTIELKPIGVIHSVFESPENMPIQGAVAPESTGQVSVFPKYTDGLQDLEKFSHLILIYYLHESDDYVDLTVEPFLENQIHGVFATRAPRRPNAIGLTVVELESITDGELQVQGLDVIDGTPLLDIKPYIPDVDAHAEANDGWIDGRMASSHRADDRFV